MALEAKLMLKIIQYIFSLSKKVAWSDDIYIWLILKAQKTLQRLHHFKAYDKLWHYDSCTWKYNIDFNFFKLSQIKKYIYISNLYKDGFIC